ncbi:MAG TPA: hypothetical protein VFV07_09995, partial [Rhizomicrobium sp.]|nr:hypothetical protein [Rhizomicrobium sp.]
EPDPLLLDTMLLLRSAFKSSEYVIDDQDGLYRHFRAACEQLAAGRTALWNSPSAQLPEWLSLRRSRPDLKGDLDDPRLTFLNGMLEDAKDGPDPGRAERLLAQVSAGVRIKGGAEAPLPHGAALLRIWAAMRELTGGRGTSLADPAVAVLWDRALGLWASNASWFGLHGHVWMGPLAAINSQIRLRARFAGSAEYSAAQDVREPFGACASALYSIAQRMDSRGRKLWHYRQVIALATRVVERDPGAQEGALSIRGHALMRMALLGEIWKLIEAVQDLQKSYDLRVRAGAPPASIGEALCDLGFARVLTGRIGSGLAMMGDGIGLMRSDTSVNGKAFLARGLRKLETAGKITLSPGIMRKAREERRAIAEETEALDQARDA